MKKIDLGQTLGLVANVGVIAGIVFLGIELQQNNALMAAEQRESRNQRRQNIVTDVAGTQDLAEILVKVGTGEALSPVEELRFFSFNLRRLYGFEAQFVEFQEGTTDLLPTTQMRNLFHIGGPAGAPISRTWEQSKSSLSEDFVQFMEERIVAPGPPD